MELIRSMIIYGSQSVLTCNPGRLSAGTNFLVRCKAVREAGWSPQYTMTEDFALGMEMKKAQWHCRYVQAYLAIGEAPDQIRNCFQQRSRWTKVGVNHFCILLCAYWAL